MLPRPHAPSSPNRDDINTQKHPQPLIIVALNARPLAAIARIAHYQPYAIDAFGDHDLETHRHAYLPLHKSTAPTLNAWHNALDAIDPNRTTPIIYGSGLERCPHLLNAIHQRPLYGNPPHILSHTTNPQRFFATLDQLAIPYPPISFARPPPNTKRPWLCKHAASSGGTGITYLSHHTTHTQDTYYQHAMSDTHHIGLSFLANGTACVPLGFSRQRHTHHITHHPRYPLRLDIIDTQPPPTETLAHHVITYATQLTKTLTLRGINSIDVLYAKKYHAPFVLELNPRPGIALDLFATEHGSDLLRWHCQQCQNNPSPLPSLPAIHTLMPQGLKILYAPQTIPSTPHPHILQSHINRYATGHVILKDMPKTGTTIKKDAPFCTIHAQGKTIEDVHIMLASTEKNLYGALARGRVKGRGRHTQRKH
ncbi:MAG: ATP-grasp domain-containing protein [Alphaproteobacteria bacterium GM7ARS4]|nr:ATP-grasp domain-containing protein [Alphaproteobacteria bacterium GM7ARS4]